MSPKVSICIPLYNTEKFIGETLTSVLNQTYSDFEIIISDNASTDKSLEIVRSFKDPRLKIYPLENPIEGRANWNRVVSFAQGELIALYHSDDFYCPTIIEEEVRTFENNPSLGAVFTLGNFIDEQSRVIGPFKAPAELPDKPFYEFMDIFIPFMENSATSMLCPSAMIPKKVYQEIGLYEVYKVTFAFDYEYYFRILEKHPIAIIRKPLMHYRRHSRQGTTNWHNLRTEPNIAFKVVDKYLNMEPFCHQFTPKNLHAYQMGKMKDFAVCGYNALLKGDPRLALEFLAKSRSKERFVVIEFLVWLTLKMGMTKTAQFLAKLPGQK